MKKIYSILSLTRIYVFLPFTFLIILLGFDKIQNWIELKSFIFTSLAFSFSLIAAFSFNDIEDSNDDLSSEYPRNPISLGYLTRKEGLIVSIVSSIFSLLFSSLVSLLTLTIVIIILILTFYYSWKNVRLKTLPPFDVVTHFFVFGLIFLGGAWANPEGFDLSKKILYTWLSISVIGMLALMLHQLYEYKGDNEAGVRTTLTVLGWKRSIVSIVFLITILISSIIIEIYNNYIPIITLLIFAFTSMLVMTIYIIFSSENKTTASKKIFPWALNIGALFAFIHWILRI